MALKGMEGALKDYYYYYYVCIALSGERQTVKQMGCHEIVRGARIHQNTHNMALDFAL